MKCNFLWFVTAMLLLVLVVAGWVMAVRSPEFMNAIERLKDWIARSPCCSKVLDPAEVDLRRLESLVRRRNALLSQRVEKDRAKQALLVEGAGTSPEAITLEVELRRLADKLAALDVELLQAGPLPPREGRVGPADWAEAAEALAGAQQTVNKLQAARQAAEQSAAESQAALQAVEARHDALAKDRAALAQQAVVKDRQLQSLSDRLNTMERSVDAAAQRQRATEAENARLASELDQVRRQAATAEADARQHVADLRQTIARQNQQLAETQTSAAQAPPAQRRAARVADSTGWEQCRRHAELARFQRDWITAAQRPGSVVVAAPVTSSTGWGRGPALGATAPPTPGSQNATIGPLGAHQRTNDRGEVVVERVAPPHVSIRHPWQYDNARSTGVKRGSQRNATWTHPWQKSTYGVRGR